MRLTSSVHQEDVEHRRREQEGVDPVEHAAVAGDQGRAVLHARAPLEQRLEQVAHDPEADQGEADQQQPPGRDRGQPRPAGQRQERGRDEEAADRPLDGLLGADDRRQRVAAEQAPGVVLRRVADDDRRDEQDDRLAAGVAVVMLFLWLLQNVST